MEIALMIFYYQGQLRYVDKEIKKITKKND